jgi:Uma2 family endonuclease
MSIATLSGWTDQAPPFPVRRFTVPEYHQLIKAGFFAKNESYELLEGWIVPKMNRNPPHDVAIVLAGEVIRPMLPAGWHLRTQSAITTDDSEPEPDIAVVRGVARSYLANHPLPKDVGLLLESADASLLLDRTTKGRLYARARIPMYWIINLQDSRLEVYTDPSGPGPSPGYRQHRDYGPDEAVPLILDGQEVGHITVRDLLP